ncbi:MAG: hypothetical protein E6K49_05270 [Gammaproteobacteria bacterium]|nr:MAG: hypothetical protein E6K49_05270 [Gammaproteobacteria bacterium]
MDNSGKKTHPPNGDDAAQEAERRRIGKVVHDDRGNASVEWQDAPPDYRRPVLEIIEERPPEAQPGQPKGPHDPYQRVAAGEHKTGNTTRTDLRKLSEWIKLVRAIEEKKRNGGEDTDD